MHLVLWKGRTKESLGIYQVLKDRFAVGQTYDQGSDHGRLGKELHFDRERPSLGLGFNRCVLANPGFPRDISYSNNRIRPRCLLATQSLSSMYPAALSISNKSVST